MPGLRVLNVSRFRTRDPLLILRMEKLETLIVEARSNLSRQLAAVTILGADKIAALNGW